MRFPCLASVLFFFWFTLLGDLAKSGISISRELTCVCAEYHLWLESDQVRHFWGKLHPLPAWEFPIFSSIFVQRSSQEVHCELTVRLLTAGVSLGYTVLPWHASPWIIMELSVPSRQTFRASLAIKTLYSRNILRNQGRGHQNLSLDEF